MSENDAISFHVGVRVVAGCRAEFRLWFDFRDDQGVNMRCNRDLSKDEGRRLENLVTNFIGNITDVIFRVQ
jgi:hypothetical protein